MEKYLFNDGTNGTREVQSKEELQELIISMNHPETARIWIFSSHEWISYTAFIKQYPSFITKIKPVSTIREYTQLPRSANGKRWLKKFLFFTGAAVGIFLVFNFTKIKWEKTAPVTVIAPRPDNVPVMDIDSLIYAIEDAREENLDRSTKTNLRIRNNWPDRIQLQLNSDREISTAGTRYSNMEVLIDNSTGYNIDNAVVRLTIWKDKKPNHTDTLNFNNISYSGVAKRSVNNTYRGDSLSLSFQSIRAKGFNFCYSAASKNNSGNYNDRWFCIGGQ